ncbi:MAG: SAM-dependent methyltransferase [Pseudomonadota bacterium]|nr:SAM-dependent methyltransferase [Pseudomonadota bacterium]
MNFPPLNITGLPEPDKLSAEHSHKLAIQIQQVMADRGGAIPFSEFMHLALYAPAMGYYAAGQRRFGAEGDFVTAPELGDVFGQCLARQVAQVFEEIDAPCDILEFGAGSGRLAVALVKELDRLAVLPEHYYILETSADLQQRQRQMITEQLPQHSERFVWLDSMPQQAITGVVLANEVLDAMPVEMFAVDDEGVAQQYLVESAGSAAEEFQWACRSSEGLLAEQIAELELPAGYSSELNPAIRGWIAMIEKGLNQGVVLLVDYGFPRHEYYHPQRTGGTMMCHFRHHSHSNPLALVGIQDITAHVDFTGVAEAAIAAELDVLGYTTQANFLLSSGLTEVVSLADAGEEEISKPQLVINHEIQLLTSPAEMGELFKVIALGKGIEHELLGFIFRDMRGKL